MGLRLEYSIGANHWRVIDPGTGAFLTTVAGTPSDVNWWHQVRRAVQKAGYSWEGRKRRKIKKPRAGEVSDVDREALAYAQQMARLHGEREPQIEDLEDKQLLAEVRRGYNEQQSEEAKLRMAQGVESARAHRVVSRLLYLVEQRGAEMAARAKERNPKIRDGGIIQELMFVSKQVSEERGLRYWKSPESAQNTLTNLLSGTSAGMSTWVANLLEATMDKLDGLRWDTPPAVAPEPEPVTTSTEQGNGRTTAKVKLPPPPTPSIDEAKTLMRDVLSTEWTSRGDMVATLVPEQMSQTRFDDALRELLRSKEIEWEYEKKKGGGRLYKLVAAEPDEPEVEPQTGPVIITPGIEEDELIVVSPEMLSDGPEKRSLLQAMTGGSIADRYADVLLDKVREVNGSTDWNALEPILIRLDKLAGIGVGSEE